MIGTIDILRNPLRAQRHTDQASRAVLDFHRRMPAYEATLLIDAPQIAASLGVARVLVKAENRRLGLPSFKILGASWATYRAVVDHLGYEPEPWSNINELARRHLDHLRPFALAAATDGNHGRAVAFMARLLGFHARIFVPAGTVAARIDAIERENATVIVVDGDYDAAVERAALEAGERCLVISDTSWPGYESTPRRVIEGYHTIFFEIDDALDAAAIEKPQIVVAPIGVGALMAAAVAHYRARAEPVVLIGVEPADADCVLRSARSGQIEAVPGPHQSIMVGLNCGTPSPLAWPLVSSGVDWFVSIDDDWARQAMRALAGAGVVAGETGAAALGGFTAFATGPDSEARRQAIGLDKTSTVLVLCTEGATDPVGYRSIVARDADTVGRVMTVAS
ncbi:MAG: diaminopropionate ammonia-lyase [Acidimicrobiales bacterium]